MNDNKYLKSNYEIDENGYLKIAQFNNQTENDKKIEKIIKGEKQYVLSVSSSYYMMDKVTGEIVDNPYNELDAYQTYDYCKNENKTIIFISENKDKKMSSDEIFLSVLSLMNM